MVRLHVGLYDTFVGMCCFLCEEYKCNYRMWSSSGAGLQTCNIEYVYQDGFFYLGRLIEQDEIDVL